MPSVEAMWRGQCTDRSLQEELCARVAELGEISHQLYREFFQKEVEAVWYDGFTIASEILLDEGIFPNRQAPPELEAVEKRTYRANQVSLYGCQYKLFDPREFNSPLTMSAGYDLSFIFLRSENPSLDGLLVEKIGEHPRSEESAESNVFLLASPEIYMRYYLENWMGRFLGWVKHYYIPDLYYWIWVDHPGYLQYEGFNRKDAMIRDEIFASLLEAFQEEAESCKDHHIKYPKKHEPENTSYARMIITPDPEDED